MFYSQKKIYCNVQYIHVSLPKENLLQCAINTNVLPPKENLLQCEINTTFTHKRKFTAMCNITIFLLSKRRSIYFLHNKGQ